MNKGLLISLFGVFLLVGLSQFAYAYDANSWISVFTDKQVYTDTDSFQVSYSFVPSFSTCSKYLTSPSGRKKLIENVNCQSGSNSYSSPTIVDFFKRYGLAPESGNWSIDVTGPSYANVQPANTTFIFNPSKNFPPVISSPELSAYKTDEGKAVEVKAEAVDDKGIKNVVAVVEDSNGVPVLGSPFAMNSVSGDVYSGIIIAPKVPAGYSLNFNIYVEATDSDNAKQDTSNYGISPKLPMILKVVSTVSSGAGGEGSFSNATTGGGSGSGCPIGCVCTGNTVACAGSGNSGSNTTVDGEGSAHTSNISSGSGSGSSGAVPISPANTSVSPIAPIPKTNSTTIITPAERASNATTVISQPAPILKPASEGRGVLETSVASAEYEGDFFVSGSNLVMNTSTGQRQINIMPEDAVNISGASLSNVKVGLKETNQKPVYSVIGTRQARLFFIMPVQMEINTDVDAGTGAIISVTKPWWSFLAW